jgi:hypothetical protein
MRTFMLLTATVVLGASIAATAGADPGTHSSLTAIASQGAGLVEVAPTAHDVLGPGTFNVEGTVNVHDAVAGTTFTVLRRVDLNPDGICTGATWLLLPPPNAQTLTTAAEGGGASTSRSRGARPSWTESASTCSGGSSAATAPSCKATASP